MKPALALLGCLLVLGCANPMQAMGVVSESNNHTQTIQGDAEKLGELISEETGIVSDFNSAPNPDARYSTYIKYLAYAERYLVHIESSMKHVSHYEQFLSENGDYLSSQGVNVGEVRGNLDDLKGKYKKSIEAVGRNLGAMGSAVGHLKEEDVVRQKAISDKLWALAAELK